MFPTKGTAYVTPPQNPELDPVHEGEIAPWQERNFAEFPITTGKYGRNLAQAFQDEFVPQANGTEDQNAFRIAKALMLMGPSGGSPGVLAANRGERGIVRQVKAFHGTSEPKFEQFKPNSFFVQDLRPGAKGFAEDYSTWKGWTPESRVIEALLSLRNMAQPRDVLAASKKTGSLKEAEKEAGISMPELFMMFAPNTMTDKMERLNALTRELLQSKGFHGVSLKDVGVGGGGPGGPVNMTTHVLFDPKDAQILREFPVAKPKWNLP
jgi:hypothetical protein